MKHLGDITKITGYDAPVVDCIIGGSPCQDLSVAGKRAGLAGERSGLYMEQIRIIKEMRHKDELRGRTGESIRPRYMVWENVPGAFSSNKGKDFAAVLEEAIRVAEPEAPDVPVPEKGWPTSGCIMGDNWSVAWRVLDAQFWGVPQRRRRIALVADFGGQSAQEILFIRKGVSRDFDESEQERKATARDAKNCFGADDRARSVGFPLGFRPENVRCYDEVATTLCNGTRPGFTTGVIQPVSIENHPADSRVDIDESGKVQTLTSRMGTGGGNVPMVMEPVTLEPGIAQREGGHIYEGVCGTLRANAGDNQMAVAHPVIAVDQGGGKSGANFHHDLSPTLTCTHGGEPAIAYGIQGSMIGRADHNGPQGDGVNEDVSFTLNTTDRHAVVYGISPYHSNCMLSDNPHSGYYEADTARTLDALQCGYPGCNQGGMAVVEPVESFLGNGQSVVGTLMANAGTKLWLGNQEAFSGAYHIVERRMGVRYIVRRLTPLECERLQGFPDGWTDIGEWVDSKGKKHKEADSPRYKALGNSIAMPPWKWVLKRLCGCYERDATMASLFDGIGGFPLIWEQLNGKGSCLWASEIEEFPIAVTKLRFGGNDDNG